MNAILYPLNNSKCFVNGKLIDKETQLETGSLNNKILLNQNNEYDIKFNEKKSKLSN